MTDEEQASDKAWEAYNGFRYYSGELKAACRADHQAMIAATPGLCVHEADGTVRRLWSREL